MQEDLLNKVLLLVCGSLAGILAGMAGAAFKAHLQGKVEARRKALSFLFDRVQPLRVAADELRRQIRQIHPRLLEEREIQEQDLKDSYHLRKWLWWCKDHVTGAMDCFSDEQRRADFALHSGGAGCEAVSTLYLTGYYLFFATQALLSSPARERDSELTRALTEVRRAFSGLDFYRVTQDSTGASMRNETGGVMNYRDFGEAMTDKAERAWFLTLADTYYKLHSKDPERVQALMRKLDELVGILDKKLGAAS